MYSRIQYLDQFDDGALAQMTQASGYMNVFTGATERATLDELAAVYEYRAERAATWAANETAAPISDVESDTVAVTLWDLEINGAVAEDHKRLDRWHAIRAAARALMAASHDVDLEFLAALYASRFTSALVVAGNLEDSAFTARLTDAGN
jgi:hypothetical protein